MPTRGAFLRRKIERHEDQIKKHQGRIDVARDKIIECENELERIQDEENYFKSLREDDEEKRRLEGQKQNIKDLGD